MNEEKKRMRDRLRAEDAADRVLEIALSLRELGVTAKEICAARRKIERLKDRAARLDPERWGSVI